MNILIVDDELSFRILIRDVLTDDGHTVVLADNGQEGMNKLAEGKIDIVISDLHMHVMDGLKFCRTAREVTAYRDIPFLFVSAYEDEDTLKAIKSLKNSAFLRKGGAMSKLISEIQFLTSTKEQGGGYISSPAPLIIEDPPHETGAPIEFHILVVDDDDALRMILEDTLSKEGYVVTTAADGDLGIDLFQKKYFDLVLLDIMMPTISGFEVLKFIKDNVPSTKVIMLTAYADLKLAVEAKQMGASDFIGKPFMRLDLLNTIKKVLSE